MKFPECVSCVIVTILCYVIPTMSHGRLKDPPSRSSMWRYGYNTPPNYNDNQLFCGGFQIQYGNNGGKCGFCGDPWTADPRKRDNEYPGPYANGIIVKSYEVGQKIEVTVEITAAHKGYFEFRICARDNYKEPITQECLDQGLLTIATSTEHRFSGITTAKEYKVELQLPSGLQCKSCVLQWKYNAGNSWGTDQQTGKSCVGCGNQEQFYGCADIAIGHDVQMGVVPPGREIPEVKKDGYVWTPEKGIITGDQCKCPCASSGHSVFSINNILNHIIISYIGISFLRL